MNTSYSNVTTKKKYIQNFTQIYIHTKKIVSIFAKILNIDTNERKRQRFHKKMYSLYTNNTDINNNNRISQNITFYLNIPLIMMQFTIKRIILHCSANDASKKVFDINSLFIEHVKKGYKGIGYHYVIDWEGKIWNTRNPNTIGAHCKGYNKNSIGICYLGGIKDKKATNTLTNIQKTNLQELIDDLCMIYNLNPYKDVYLHNELANKECPCFNREYYTNMILEYYKKGIITNSKELSEEAIKNIQKFKYSI